MNQSQMNDMIQLRITQQLYQHSAGAIYTNMLNVLAVGYVFRNVMDPAINFSWLGICLSYLLFRLFFTRSIIKKQIELANYRRRLWQFGITVCLSGILFGSAGIIYLSLTRPAYNAFIFFLMGGIFAGSLGAFSIDKRIFAAYAAPLILPVTIYSFILGDELNVAMGAMGILFILMMALLVSRMNATLVSAFRLEIQNTQLATDTQRLNEELLAANEQLRQLSLNDLLTNTTNRRFVTDILQEEVDRFIAARLESLAAALRENDLEKTRYGLFMLDIDNFKHVNDTWGHKCGDQVLIQFADILKSLVRKDDVVTRWGGEEFLIILKNALPEHLQKFAEKVIRAVAASTFKIDETRSISMTCSVGFVEFPFYQNEPEALSLEQTLEIADWALYDAKKNGRNQAVYADHNPSSGVVVTAAKGVLLGENLSTAIDNKYILLTRGEVSPNLN